MFTFNPDNRKHTILSIDGGGMRGVIPLKMLVYLEEQTGKPAYDLFDMVAGTSTGAIIAAGLAIGMTAKKLLEEIYRETLPNAFQRKSLLGYVFSGLRHFYPIEPFVEVLAPLAKGKRMKDIQKPIVLFTTKDLRTSNTYYIVNRGKGAKMFAEWPLAGAVAASSAAPIFFPPILGNLVDGGVGAFGNPCLAASIEAVEYIGFAEEDTLHISLGTGYITTNRKDSEAANYWLRDWVEYLVVEGLDDASLQQVYNNRAIYKRMDFRRYNPDLSRHSVYDVLGVDVGDIDPKDLGLDTRTPEAIALMERIGEAYAKALDWTLPKTMPWETLGGHAKPTIAPVEWKGSIFDFAEMPAVRPPSTTPETEA